MNYQDTVTFYKVSGGEYGSNKTVVSSASVKCIFIQNTQYIRANYQDNIDADAFCYPNPTNSFISGNNNRLEGMYIRAPLFSADNDDSWYKIDAVTVNRDHLLTNQIDNIELLLKKATALPGVS